MGSAEWLVLAEGWVVHKAGLQLPTGGVGWRFRA